MNYLGIQDLLIAQKPKKYARMYYQLVQSTWQIQNLCALGTFVKDPHLTLSIHVHVTIFFVLPFQFTGCYMRNYDHGGNVIWL